MNLNTRNIVLLNSGRLAAWDLKAEDLSPVLAEWDQVADVRVVGDFTDKAVGGILPGDRIFPVGLSEPSPGLDPSHQQYPVDLSGPMPWLDEPAQANVLSLIRAALAQADAEPKIKTEAVVPIRQVLVFGRGLAAAETVAGLAAANLKTVWAVPFGDLPSFAQYQSQAEVVHCQGIRSIKGFAGRFTVILDLEGASKEVQAGAIFLCGPERREGTGIFSGDRSVTLSAFENEIMSGAPPAWAEISGFRIAFLAGVGSAISTASMGRIMGWASKAALETKAAVYVLAPNVKVAGKGLERLYGRAREAGVTFIRTPAQGPQVFRDESGVFTFRLFDPVARAELTLTPDLLVFSEALVPADEFQAWSQHFGLITGQDGFLAPDNVLFLPAATNRRGIFALGPARGTDSAETLAAEITGAVSETRSLLDTKVVEVNRVQVKDDLCAHCLSCLRICPMEAINFTGRPWPNPLACVACGLCAARCPAKAITLAGHGDDAVLAGLKILLARKKTTNRPRLVLFGCRRSAGVAMKNAPGPLGPVDLSFMPLPCGGKIDDNLVLQSFVNGADGVLIGVCHEDNCRTQEGSPEARRRAARLHQLMSEVGFDPKRLRFFTVAPNMGYDFSRTIADFALALDRLDQASPSGK
jgi:coenzyme F420-reducing hydrogenase delta subunit/Pyruvate/2-oxoacid:ferredoxin oxidoreductase delta subunit